MSVGYNSQTQALTLNVLEIKTSADGIQIFVAPLEDKNQPKRLRSSYSDYKFYRQGNELFAWQSTSSPSSLLPPEFREIKIERKEQTLVFNRILEDSLVDVFKKSKSSIKHLKFSSTWEVESQKEIRRFKDLTVIPTLNFSVHPFYSSKTDSVVAALSVNVSHKFRFSASEKQLQSQNIDTRNWTRNSNGETVASLANVQNYVRASGQQSLFDKYKNEIDSNRYCYAKVEQFHRLFRNFVMPKAFLPANLEILDFLLFQIPNSNFEASSINKPRYYYHQDRTGQGYYNEAVKNQRPYTFDGFKDKSVNVLVLTPKIYEGTTGEFIPKLKNKLASTFHLNQINFDILTADTPHQTFTDVLDKSLSPKKQYDG